MSFSAESTGLIANVRHEISQKDLPLPVQQTVAAFLDSLRDQKRDDSWYPDSARVKLYGHIGGGSPANLFIEIGTFRSAPPEARQDIPGTLPIYQSHKQVRAAKITSISQGPAGEDKDGGTWVLYVDDGTTAGDSVEVTHKWYEKHQPVVGGYFVQYADGYKSYSPAEAFESGYEKF